LFQKHQMQKIKFCNEELYERIQIQTIQLIFGANTIDHITGLL